MNGSHKILETLAQSQLFRDYEEAFSRVTGLPMTLRSVDSWHLPFHRMKNENPFCAIMAGKSGSCATCLHFQQRIGERSIQERCTTACGAGLSETAVPVRTGDKLIGFLQTGQVFLKKPSEAGFQRTLKSLNTLGVEVNVEELRIAYFATRVLPSHQYSSMLQLLSIFSEHLASVSNKIFIQQQNAEPALIVRAKQLISERHTEVLYAVN